MSASSNSNQKPPKAVLDSVLVESEAIDPKTPTVKGYDFNKGMPSIEELLKTYTYSGFQSTNLGLAIEEINKMIHWRLSDEPITKETSDEHKSDSYRKNAKCKIFLGYTSNLISSGLREVIKFLVQHNFVDVIVSTAGGIEEDFIKCLAPTYMGDFRLKGSVLRDKGLNRIGNLIVPNENYCKFEKWINPILDQMHKEQQEEKTVWTPSRMIHRLGKEIDNPDSVYYWAYKNNIPVFCPALTDGSIGDMLYFHSYKVDPPITLDIVRDIRAMNDHASWGVHKSGMIILGGGLVKHHICNANLMRNGADFSVFINTGQEFDGSDSGARPDEAISWGKIRAEAKPVKLYAEATLVFPFIVSQTFAKYYYEQQKKKNETN